MTLRTGEGNVQSPRSENGEKELMGRTRCSLTRSGESDARVGHIEDAVPALLEGWEGDQQGCLGDDLGTTSRRRTKPKGRRCTLTVMYNRTQ